MSLPPPPPPPPLNPQQLDPQPLDPQPARVEPIGYYTPSGPPRPGILVAVGIISIVVGIITILTSCSGIVQSIAFGSMSAIVIPPPTTAQAFGANPFQPTVQVMVRMTADERQIVADALAGKHGLTPQQMEMLALLLTQAGDDVVPFSGANITPQTVSGAVTGSGQTRASDGSAVTYFIVVNGRIEVSDQDASFSPARGGANVRVNRPQLGQAGAVSTTAYAPTGKLTPGVTFAKPTGRTLGLVIFGAATSLIGMGLAILLLIAGILVLVQRRSARKLHLFYAWARVPAAILGAFAMHFLTAQYLNRIAGLGTGFTGTVMMVQSVIYCIIACIYPVALLIVMNTRSVRDYYQHLTVK